MKIFALRPMLWTDDLSGSVEFYTRVLGFQVGEHNDEWGWASLYKDSVEIMLARPNEHTPFTRPTFTGSFYFNLEDVEAAWNDLKEKAKICYELETFEYGMREFAIYDNNGYILQFGQEVEN
jgi:catechol 2,3-dioxygenase-like lactoylglutathione lyase family enzyme